MTRGKPQQKYALRITQSAARSLSKGLPDKIAFAVHEFLTTAHVDNPQRVGKRLPLPPYLGTWSARRGGYRVLYEIDEDKKTVTVTAVEHRGDAYRPH